ncbi:putative hydrolase [Nostocoides japonicum T1-X7]|uniref:Putative hydrolase n=1 Tax=Nostocoides japonicum T1-X7 TaxID=1194083 RepID=A0A077LWB8_9MICO|nr:carbon-nitrogen hydrolase family protein [Tetrasphaera japonica]CCH76294.1 putative hydrolase [Tetrasphaera japonica T1-X7]
MSRPLCLALAQAPGRRPDDLEGFGRHASTTLRLFPQTQLLVYPELHLADDDTRPLEGSSVRDSAEPIADGPRHRYLSRLAADLQVWLCPGSVSELGADGHVYNTAVVYSPRGQLVATYRKVFPWRPFEGARPGREFVVFDIPQLGRVGLSICYDAWFPESSRHLAWMGAEIILNVVKTATVDREQEIVLARANATVNQVFVASVNAAGPSGQGHSVLVGPEGTILSELPNATPGILTAVVDLDTVDNARRFGSFGFTRPWSQFLPDDDPIPLPLYQGVISPLTWSAANNRGQKS